jgi:hypothetical protein
MSRAGVCDESLHRWDKTWLLCQRQQQALKKEPGGGGILAGVAADVPELHLRHFHKGVIKGVGPGIGAITLENTKPLLARALPNVSRKSWRSRSPRKGGSPWSPRPMTRCVAAG